MNPQRQAFGADGVTADALPSADVYASANGMINNYGDGAESQARQRAQRYAGRHDSEGHRIWLAIATAIGVLQHNAPAHAKRSTGA